jgi:hypothetical protein
MDLSLGLPDAYVTTKLNLQSTKSKVGLAAAKAAVLRINLNVQGCVIERERVCVVYWYSI